MIRFIKLQTTYWEFIRDERTLRVCFKKKKESRFVDRETESFEFVEDHPVLMPYQNMWQSIYIASRPESIEETLKDLLSTIGESLSPWRDPSHYFNPHAELLPILQSGSGLLFTGPDPIAMLVLDILGKRGVRFTVHAAYNESVFVMAFVSGRNYIVAEKFQMK